MVENFIWEVKRVSGIVWLRFCKEEGTKKAAQKAAAQRQTQTAFKNAGWLSDQGMKIFAVSGDLSLAAPHPAPKG